MTKLRKHSSLFYCNRLETIMPRLLSSISRFRHSVALISQLLLRRRERGSPTFIKLQRESDVVNRANCQRDWKRILVSMFWYSGYYCIPTPLYTVRGWLDNVGVRFGLWSEEGRETRVARGTWTTPSFGCDSDSDIRPPSSFLFRTDT